MRLDELPEPTLGPHDVLLRVRVVQPSVTEAILAAGHDTFGAEVVRARLERGPAALFGHEYCAEVLDVGPAVRRLRPGARVVDTSTRPCFACALCREGRSDECRRGPHVGFDLPGALAELTALSEHGLVEMPDEVSDYAAAALQPAADCVASIESARIEPGDLVAVLGQGTLGLLTTQLARQALARSVIAVDVRPEALSLAADLGADHCVDANAADPVEAVLELTDGRGVDVVVDCAGGPPEHGLAGPGSLNQALGLVRDSGRAVVSALIPGAVPLDVNRWRLRSVDLVFPLLGAPRHLRLAAEMAVQGRLRVEPLVSHVVWGLERAPRAFEITADKQRFGATGPCQIVVDTERVPPHPLLERGDR